MSTEHDLTLLIQTAKGLAKLMGDETEIVLHDLIEHKIVFIANGHITGRSVGYQLKENMLINAVLDSVDEDGHAVGSKSKTIEGKILKVSHFVYYDEIHKPYAMICINQDVSQLAALKDKLDNYIGTEKNEITDHHSSNNDEHYIHQVVKNLINDEMEKLKPTPLNTKETKLKVLETLENKGVFDVKDSVPQVCEMLSISQATLYNYLRELRQK